MCKEGVLQDLLHIQGQTCQASPPARWPRWDKTPLHPIPNRCDHRSMGWRAPFVGCLSSNLPDFTITNLGGKHGARVLCSQLCSVPLHPWGILDVTVMERTNQHDLACISFWSSLSSAFPFSAPWWRKTSVWKNRVYCDNVRATGVNISASSLHNHMLSGWKNMLEISHHT